jgi:chemotaxis receptor (MCP) glutamine deamidase CheD
MIKTTLSKYGATLNEQNVITKGGKCLGVVVKVVKNRIKFMHHGILLASGPVEARTVDKFVKQYWYWEEI